MAGAEYSTHRMAIDYTNNFYLPAINAARRLRENDYALTREVTGWMNRMSDSWDKIAIKNVDIPDVGGTLFVGQKFPIKIDVVLGEINPNDVSVEIVSGKLNSQEQILQYEPSVAALIGGDNGVYTFSGEVTCGESGRFGITARIIPRNENLPHTIKPKMISWW
jgi:starch phosphorylase